MFPAVTFKTFQKILWNFKTVMIPFLFTLLYTQSISAVSLIFFLPLGKTLFIKIPQKSKGERKIIYPPHGSFTLDQKASYSIPQPI
jgi:hypothetical protein